jgi:hypothetical protein
MGARETRSGSLKTRVIRYNTSERIYRSHLLLLPGSGCLVLHALAIAAVLLAGPGWLGLVVAIRNCAARDAEQASPERDTARDMRLAA